MANTTKKQADITKSGYQTYRDLQQLNNSQYQGNATSPDIITNIGTALRSNTPYEQTASISKAAGPVYDPRFDSSRGKDNWGSSMFDEQVLSDENAGSWEDIRAENQPWYTKALAGTTKGAVLAGTTFVDGTLGLLYGIGDSIFDFQDRGDGTFIGALSRIWDNPITSAMNSINKASEEYLPNYYTQDELESPWYTNILSTNFIFDKIVKNAGFTVGAAYSGGVYSKLIGSVAKLGSATKMGIASKLGANVTPEAIQMGEQAMQAANATRQTKQLVGGFFSATAEGMAEAYNNSSEWVTAKKHEVDADIKNQLEMAQTEYMINKGQSLQLAKDADGKITYIDPAWTKYQQDLARIKKAKETAYAKIDSERAKMGTWDMIANIPLLWYSDVKMFGKMYSGGWKAERQTAKAETKATKEALANAKQAVKDGTDKDAVKKLKDIVKKAEKTGYQGLEDSEKQLVEQVSKRYKLGRKTGAAVTAVKPIVREGLVEEMGQSAIGESTGLYYGNIVDNAYAAALDPDAKEKTLEWYEATLQGLKNTYLNPDKYEEAFIGGLMGLMGSPTFGRSSNNTDQTWLGKGKFLGLTGGAVTEVRDYLRDRDNEDARIAGLNNALSRPDFQKRFQHLIAQTYYDDQKKKYVLMDDKKAYEDAETASIIEDIMYFKNTNRMDLLMNALNNSELVIQEDKSLQEIIDSTTRNHSSGTIDIDSETEQLNNAKSKLNKLQNELDDRDQAVSENIEKAGDNDDLLNEAIEAMQEWSKSDERRALQEAIDDAKEEVTFHQDRINRDSSGTSSPYINSDGSTKTLEEVREDIKKRTNHIKDLIKSYTNEMDSIDNATGQQLTDSQLATLTWYKVMMSDWSNRAEQLGQDLKYTLQDLLSDPRSKQLVSALDKVLNTPEGQLELSEETKQLYGGLLTNKKNYFKGIREVLDLIEKVAYGNESEDSSRKSNKNKAQYGIALARILANENQDKEGDKTIGQQMVDYLTALIDSNEYASDDEKTNTKTKLNDLVRIGYSYGQYNKLLQEFLKDPSQIDVAHHDMENKASAQVHNKKAAKIADRFDWTASVGDIANTYQENKSDIEKIGGLNKFMNSLPADNRKKLKNAINLLNFMEGAHSHIDDKIATSGGSDLERDIAHKLLDSIPDDFDVDCPADVQDRINELLGKEGYLDDILASQNLDLDDIALNNLRYTLEESLQDVITDSVEKALMDIDELEAAQEQADREREAKINSEDIPEDVSRERKISGETPEDLASEPEINGKDIVEKDIEGKDIDVEAPDKKTPKKSKEVSKINLDRVLPAEIPDLDIDLAIDSPSDLAVKGTTKKNAKTARRDWEASNSEGRSKTAVISITPGKKGYERRGIISEYRIGKDIADFTTYPDYLASTGRYPDGITEKNKPAYLKYVTEVRDYLHRVGAFHYVSHNLKPSQTIYFITDPELNTKAETDVVLMAVKDDNAPGGFQVIGSIRSALDFEAFHNLSETKQKELFNVENMLSQEKLYNTVLQGKAEGKYILDKEKQNIEQDSTNKEPEYITTQVDQLMDGSLPLSKEEHTVSEIYDKAKEGIRPIFGIVKDGSSIDTGNETINGKIINPRFVQKGQVYLLIPSNKGYTPALCWSTPINSLASDDWYKQQAIKAVQQVASNPLTVRDNIDNLHKWLPIDGLYMRFIEEDISGKKYETTTKGNATVVRFKWPIVNPTKYEKDKGFKRHQYDIRLDADGNIPVEAADKLINFIAAEYIPNIKNGDGSQRYTGLTCHLDATRLNDPEYISNMSRYIGLNLWTGELGQHTKNDWFTYKEVKETKVTPPVREAPKPLIEKPAIEPAALGGRTVPYNGLDYILTDEGIVKNPDGSICTDEAVKLAIKGPSIEIVSSEPLLLFDEGETGKKTEKKVYIPGQEEDASTIKPVPKVKRKYNPRLKRLTYTPEIAEEPISTQEQTQRAIRKINSLFPGLSNQVKIKLVEGMISSFDNEGNPVEAFGTFEESIITLSKDKAPVGAAYHEGFHYAMDYIFKEDEKDEIFKAAQEQYNSIDKMELEEYMAEDFRHFMNGFDDTSLIGTIKNLFKYMKHLINNLRGKESYLDSLFWEIYRGKLNERAVEDCLAYHTQSYTQEGKDSRANMIYTSEKEDTFKEDLEKYREKKFDYDNLTQEEKDYIAKHNTSKETYQELTTDEKEIFLQCM